MPQLNPNPWFWILVMSWIIFLMLLPKTNKLKMPEEPLIKNNKYSLNPWNWPWI